MIDTEDRLRAELGELRQRELDLGLDPDALLDAGHRRITRRATQRLIGGVAAVLVVGVVAVGAISGRTLGGLPDPAQTLAVPGVSASVRVVVSSAVSEPPLRVDVTAAREGDELRITAASLAVDGSISSTVSADRHVGQPIGEALVPLGNNVYLGVLPGRAQWIDPVVDDGSRGWVATGRGVLPSLNVTAYLLLVDSADLSTLSDLIWQAEDGTVRTGTGVTLPSANLNFEGHRGTFYLDQRTKLFGLHSSEGNSGGPIDEGTHFLPDMGATRTDGRWIRFGYGLLPRGARDPELLLDHPSAKWTQLSLGDRVLIVITGETANEKADLVTSINFTDAAGVRVTQDVW
ncbi:MAG: hypothetical protein ACOH1Y_17065 [Propionicimonas sp.]